jgi:hypothetical protein
MLTGFPAFHLSVVAGGAIAGYMIGCYEAKALKQYDELIQKYKDRRQRFAPAGMRKSSLVHKDANFQLTSSAILSALVTSLRSFTLKCCTMQTKSKPRGRIIHLQMEHQQWRTGAVPN